MNEFSEKRSAPRYPHRAYGKLFVGDRSFATHLLNISIGGALIAVIDEHRLQEDAEIVLQVDDDQGSFEMKGKIAHIKDHYIGLECSPPNDDDRDRISRLIEEINARELRH